MAESCGGAGMRLAASCGSCACLPRKNFAQSLAESRHLRIDKRPVIKPAATVRMGKVLTFVTRSGDIRVVQIEALPRRRGPPMEARTLYTDVPMRKIDGTTEQN